MSLQLIESALRIAGRNTQSIQAWAGAEEKRAEKVAQFRRYAEGDHDNHLTTEQKRLLNIRGTTEDSTAFNDNLCSIILDTMLDRVHLTGVKVGKPRTALRPQPANGASEPQSQQTTPAEDWVTTLLERNRIDALQVDIHEAALRDGNTYMMVYPDPVTGEARFSHEPAYDGAFGTILMYETTASTRPLAAIKVWKITTTEIADTTRVNVYYPDRIERFIGSSQVELKPYDGDGQAPVIAWVDRSGQPLGVPFVHFKNRGSSTDNFGLSELENVMPLQNAVNVVLTSVVATALLSGFPIRALIGDKAPADVVPGRIMSFFAKDPNGNPAAPNDVLQKWLASIRLDQFEVADLNPLLEVAGWLKTEMYAVTNTPTDDVAADASGEARKQSEVKLIGKVKRFCVRNGNAWEDAVRLADRIEATYTSHVQMIADDTTLTAQWDDPEIRNDALYADELRKDYEAGLIDQRTYLEGVKDIRGWDDAKVDEIIAATEKARNDQAQQEVVKISDIEAAKAQAAQLVGATNGAAAA